jgi:hypothetical protein
MTRLFALFTAAAVLLFAMAFCLPDTMGAASPLPPWVSITTATNCTHGCWKIVDAVYWNEGESNGLHHLFARTLDSHGNQIVQPFTVAWADGSTTAQTKPPPDYGDIPLWDCHFPDQGETGAYRGFAGIWEANSDTIHGLGLPYCQHVSFVVTWQWVESGSTPTPTPAPTATPTPTPPPPLPIKLYLPVVSKG